MGTVKRDELWVGVDAGKGHHWGAAVDQAGATVWSKKVVNDETEILTAISEILALADRVHWAVDINGTASALLLAPCSRPTTRAWSTCLDEPSTGCPGPTGARPRPMPATRT